MLRFPQTYNSFLVQKRMPLRHPQSKRKTSAFVNINRVLFSARGNNMFLLCNYSTLLTLGKIILHIALQVNNSEARATCFVCRCIVDSNNGSFHGQEINHLCKETFCKRNFGINIWFSVCFGPWYRLDVSSNWFACHKNNSCTHWHANRWQIGHTLANESLCVSIVFSLWS